MTGAIFICSLVVVFQDEACAKTRSNLSGWVTPFDSGKSFDPLIENMSHYETLWFVGDNVASFLSEASLDDGWKKNADFVKIAREAAARGVRFGPVLHNTGTTGFDGALALQFMVKKDVDAAIERLARRARRFGWRAINIDFESLPELAAADFEGFISKLVKKFAKTDVRISVCLHAKTKSAAPFSGALFQRWNRLAKLNVDFVVMAYDYSWADGNPGMVAPNSWVHEVADLAQSEFDRSKLIVGLPLYGYHWKRLSGRWQGQSDTVTKLTELTQKPGWIRDQSVASEDGQLYRNGTDAVIAFDDQRAFVQKKLKLQAKKIQRFAVWRVGAEGQKFYQQLSEQRELKSNNGSER